MSKVISNRLRAGLTAKALRALLATKKGSLSVQSMRDVIGYGLIAIGTLVLLLLATNIYDYVQDFTSNPIHRYIAEFESSEKPITFGETKIQIPREYFNVVAMAFGLWFLGIWLSIGTALLDSGRKLLKQDTRDLNELLQKLIDERKRSDHSN